MNTGRLNDIVESDDYCCFGGYPGGASLYHDEQRWKNYIRDSLIETTINKDILCLSRVEKPALLRRLFNLVCEYSGRELSFQKMLGQLQDAGNTVTLAHYLQLLFQAGLATGLQKYSGETIRVRGSSPKLQVLNTALITAQTPWSASEIKGRPELWGRLVESAVGAHLANIAWEGGANLYYWRQNSQEVDFILQSGERQTAIE
ncbi:MAG: DUF4143 domain-containing protein, partial [Candidatus Riflebacteria bacterium]|nr:DUF4143 domain-containing protein [Candidatus Riflebacteria bacterium]